MKKIFLALVILAIAAPAYATNLEQVLTAEYAIKITQPDANTTYMAVAPVGAAQASAVWKCRKVVVDGVTTTVTWADGDTKFDNVATDLTALSYS